MKAGPLGLGCALLLLGCSGYPVKETGARPADLVSPPPDGQAKVCVVRPQSRVLAFKAIMRDNGHLVGATTGQSYFCYLAQPGEHRVSTTAERDSTELIARFAAGRSYYLSQYIDDADAAQQRIHFVQQWIDEASAQRDAARCRYVALVAAPGREVVPQIGAVVPALTSDGSRVVRSDAPSGG